jgi:hypothetical protein
MQRRRWGRWQPLTSVGGGCSQVHNGGRAYAPKKASGRVEGNHPRSGLEDDRKARVIGRSRCRAAHQLARWAATVDDIWPQDVGNNAPPGGDIPSATEVLAPPLLDCGQGKNPPRQDDFVITQQKGERDDGVEADGGWDDGDGVQSVSNNEKMRMQGEACESMGELNNNNCHATETTTIENLMNGAPNPHLNRECVHPSNDQLPASKLTLPPNKAHSPLSEEGASNRHAPPPPADIHLRACRRRLDTSLATVGSPNIPLKSTSVPCPPTRKTVMSVGGVEQLEGLQPLVFMNNGIASHWC